MKTHNLRQTIVCLTHELGTPRAARQMQDKLLINCAIRLGRPVLLSWLGLAISAIKPAHTKNIAVHEAVANFRATIRIARIRCF